MSAAVIHAGTWTPTRSELGARRHHVMNLREHKCLHTWKLRTLPRDLSKRALRWRWGYWGRRKEQARAAASRCTPWYVTKQIYVGDLVGAGGDRGGTDPWPNCPDPWDHGGASWYDTVRCENGGSWLDSPGYYRCGLQFDPSWETVYGRLCP